MAHYNNQYDHNAQYDQRYGPGSAEQHHQDPRGQHRMNGQYGAHHHGGYPQELGATFFPGSTDDYYMPPEVISPAPQRMMAKVPGNIQENLAHLELEGSPPMQSSPAVHRPDSISTISSMQSSRPSSMNPHPNHDYRDAAHRSPNPVELPSFSPFPRLQNPPPNIPPPDDQREATLEQARVAVLSSNDPEMQLAWAQDALAFVEISVGDELRSAENRPSRSKTPQIEHQLRVDAINVVSFLADQRHPKAEFMRGMWLEFGKFGFRVDPKEAFMSYTRAAEKGYGRAEYRIGMQFESSNDQIKAIQHYNQGVALGDSASNYRLGMMTLLGQLGQRQDYPRGVSLIRFASEHADENAPQGAYVYGMLQARELDTVTIPEIFLPLDTNGARINIEKAAYLGFGKAQVKMGAAYELCQLGCEFNPALSLHYNALASRQGEPEADMAISKWFLCGYDGVFEKNDDLAFKYAQRAAQGGLPTAEFAMGYFNEIGIGTTVDLKKAQSWYTVAAEHGNKDAAGRVDGISRSKTLSKRDHEKVAIERIKSTYGSQRGPRPERFRTPTLPMPSIPDHKIAISDPSNRVNTPGYLNAQSNGPAIQRPASAAPYPTESSNSSQGPRPVSGFLNPNNRSNSAFGIHPNMRTNTGSTAPIPLAGSPVQFQGPNGAGRGMPAGRGGRVMSGGPGIPSSYRMPGGAGSGGLTEASRPSDHADKPQPPRLDIGFSAPPDPNVDRRNKLHKSSIPNVGKPQPSLPSQGQGTPLNPYLTRPTQSPSMPQGYNPDYRPPSSRPPHNQSETPRPGSAHPSNAPNALSSYPGRQSRPDPPKPSAPTPSQTPHKASTPSRPHGSSAPAPASTSRPPGKGPKTFDEMGVPQANKDSDCVVM
ncbi:MAG: hypothetical protein M1837_002035 [Sclerophora amabilis]|nr:MAG: hypothetical protein M1837_002035 [Sclerophora amabilis]